MRRTLLLALIATSLALAAPAARAAVHNTYCGDTGDFCQGVEPNEPHITLGFHAFSFRGKYKLCVRYARGGAVYSCHQFRLRRESHGIYGSDVLFQRYFPHRRHGRYFAKWSQGGFQIGYTIWFRW